MTDRVKGLIVTFENDIREDDAENIINAIMMLKGVIGVSPNTVNPSDLMNRQRISYELKAKIDSVLSPS